MFYSCTGNVNNVTDFNHSIFSYPDCDKSLIYFDVVHCICIYYVYIHIISLVEKVNLFKMRLHDSIKSLPVIYVWQNVWHY